MSWLFGRKIKVSEPDKKTEKKFNLIKGLMEKADNPLKKKIIGNYLGCIIKDDADKRLKPLVDKWTAKCWGSSNRSYKEQLAAYEKQYEEAKDKAKSLCFSIEEELSEFEKKKYKDFCDAFQEVISSKKIWSIDEESRNSELKSWAKTTVKRAPAILKTGVFQRLKTDTQVPVFIGGTEAYFFYPKFVIKGIYLDRFDVIPIDSVDIEYKSTRFIEEETPPSDAEKVGTTYLYINKDGGPDRRYAYNPVLPILRYGEIEIRPWGIKFQISKCDTALKLWMSFSKLKAIDTYGNKESRESQENNNSPSFNHDFIKDPDEQMLKNAAVLAVLNQHISPSFIQRKLDIGYKQSCKIVLRLEQLGIVAPYISGSQRDVLIKDLSTLDEILDRSLNNPDPKPEISEDYFNNLWSASQRIYDFGIQLSQNEDFCKAFSEAISITINEKGKSLSRPQDTIPILLWQDVIRCYLELGHELDLFSNEGLGILLYSTLLYEPDLKIEYVHLNILRNKDVIDPLKNLIKELIPSMNSNKDLLWIESRLKEFDERLHSQYIILLYRFTSLIAKADGKITSEEADWLKKIMSFNKTETQDRNIEQKLTRQSNRCLSELHLNPIDELNGLIGLTPVKSEITSLANYIKIQKMREEKGMSIPPLSLHCVFTGNPGTGKTTVARIVSRIYKELGLLNKGHLVETDRSGLVAEYVGQTAVKTNKIIDSALDGILFIDEAYSLVDGGSSDYGKEAISTLLKRMEDDRDRLVVILAGYTDNMKQFIDSNPGLQSRFNRYISFPDYSEEELLKIFVSNANKFEYSITDDASNAVLSFFTEALKHKDRNFGNGRVARNLFEKVIETQANRLSATPIISERALATIEIDDIVKSLELLHY